MKTTHPLPSNRSFGWTFTAIFLLCGIYGAWHDRPVLTALLGLAGVMAAVTLTRERWLTPLNRAWMKLGELMGRVVNPIVLGLIYFGVFTPVALGMRAFGRDALRRERDAGASSYWLERDPPGPADDSYRNMF